MSLLSRLFGGGSSPPSEAQTETYKGYSITPAPVKDPAGYRIGATITKDGQTHDLIRADTVSDHETAVSISVNKAKQVIDQMGDGIFR